MLWQLSDISQKYKMGDISNGVANIAKKYTKLRI